MPSNLKKSPEKARSNLIQFVAYCTTSLQLMANPENGFQQAA
jgi:hypothetical protein